MTSRGDTGLVVDSFRNCKRLVARSSDPARLGRPLNGIANGQNNSRVMRPNLADRRVAGINADQDFQSVFAVPPEPIVRSKITL